ncbi:acid-sensing ion channel 1-like [Acropora muricata]|uniref:acid-sensing ion channel 1-like n=1 Tax=Acropora muricata TaxID=159855 RepID=UPI0034E4DFA7
MNAEFREMKENPSHCVKEAKEVWTLEKEEASRVIKDFGSYTTLHGFHFILDSGSLIRKIIWITLISLGIAFLSIQFRDNCRKLQSREIVISKDLERNKNLLFPAITICNQNMMRKSKIMGTDAQTFLDQQDTLKYHLLGDSLFSKETDPAFNIEESVKNNSHDLSEMLNTCIWSGRPCSAANFTPVLSYLRGVCHTFNSGKPGHPKLYVKTTGKFKGLTLQLDAQPEEYYGPFSYEATGFKVLVHDQSELYPNIEDFGVDIPPGFKTNIRVHRTKMKSLRAPFKTACEEKNVEPAYGVYSEYACLVDCYTKISVNACNCRMLSMPSLGVGVNETRFCSAKELFTCLFPIFDKFNPSNCKCPVPCEKITYKVELSMAYAPSDHIWDTILPLYNITPNETSSKVEEFRDYVRKRMSQFSIYYQTLDTEVTEEKPAYDLNDFGSDVGGNMGLFLGCSLLTLCEFVDLIVIMCLRCWRRRIAVEITPDQRH